MPTLEDILNAIDTLRTRLPELVGADRWPEFERRLDAHLADLGDNRLHPVIVQALILRLFAEARPAHLALLGIIDPEQAAAQSVRLGYDPHEAAAAVPKGLETFTADDTPAQSPISNLQSPISPPPLTTRYTDISCPRRVWVENRMVVMVKLTVAPSHFSRATEILNVLPSQPVEVTLTTLAFDVVGDTTQSMPIVPEADSPAAYFELRPRQAGMATISFDFRQAGQHLGRAHVDVEVTAFAVTEEMASHPGPQVRFDATQAEPPAIQLAIHYAASRGEHALIFTLFDQAGRQLTAPQSTPLRADPRRYAADLYADLSHWARASAPANTADFEANVRAIGWRLWAELLPAQIKSVYATHRTQWAGRTMLVVSDEPWIPWELVLPYDDPAASWRDDAPWAINLALHRWLGGDAVNSAIPGPPAMLRMSALACIAQQAGNLRYASDERRILQEIAGRRNVADLSPSDARLASVLALLRGGGYDWLHFATHGQLSEDNLSVSIALEDDKLTPEALYGPEIRPHIARSHPGVVLNICHGARSAWALTQLGGWAQWFLSAGAGLFVAPLWTVTDAHAFAFAQTFYDRLLADGAAQRSTVAEAVAAARTAAMGNGDPTWLAYSVYAHPNARLG